MAMEIHISIQTTKPLAGTAVAGSRGPLRFEGWLELLRVLSALLGLEGVDQVTHLSTKETRR